MKISTELEQFREELYQTFDNRADALMDLIDAVSSYPEAESVVEYSLAPCYRRSYSTISKALNEMRVDKMALPRLIGRHLPKPQKRNFMLLGTDVTPQPRPYAETLVDRGMVYEPTVLKGNKPITIGHQYSTVCYLPEPEEGVTGSWVVPFLTERVATEQDKELVGSDQIGALLTDDKLPFAEQLCVDVADSSYSKPACVHRNRHHANLVTIARLRGSRTLYRQPTDEQQEQDGAGHPTWYGDEFKLPDSSTWHAPDDELTVHEQSRRGKLYRVEIQAWHNMLMRGKQKPTPMPMHQHPFTLIRIVRYHADGSLACKNPLWLLVIGQRRHEISLADCYQAYRQRFDLEHFFRFGKQKMLLTSFQTPEDWREENWWQLVHIAYAQLWLARSVAICLPRPWERNLPAYKQKLLSPSAVQRDFGRIIRQIGSPAAPPKPRGISPGRPLGTKLEPRPKQKVVVKSQQQANAP